jgi:hypothetical protein
MIKKRTVKEKNLNSEFFYYSKKNFTIRNLKIFLKYYGVTLEIL